jgi:competence protein CoiA
MKYAIVNECESGSLQRRQGNFVQVVGLKFIAKMWRYKYMNHWSHKGVRNCDPWWENETEWHRSWKSHFPVEWQEIVHFDEKGEKHIADVKVSGDWVVEFQHSFINPEEIQTRNEFLSTGVVGSGWIEKKTGFATVRMNYCKDSRVLQLPQIRDGPSQRS